MTITEVAQVYLGNCFDDPLLNKQVKIAQTSNRCLDVELTQADCAKSRISVKLESGLKIGIIKQRDWMLREGDVFKIDRNRLLLVHLQPQQLLALSVSEVCPGAMLSLIHLGYNLGNHHCPILVTEDKVYVLLAENRAVIESTIQSMNIPGLKLTYETRSANQQLLFPKHSHHDIAHHSSTHP